MTRLMARFTTLLDSRHNVPMTSRVYMFVSLALTYTPLLIGNVFRRAIVPIGAFFSLSLICGNLAYLYLSVSFIQMLKVIALNPLA